MFVLGQKMYRVINQFLILLLDYQRHMSRKSIKCTVCQNIHGDPADVTPFGISEDGELTLEFIESTTTYHFDVPLKDILI